jgi:hypothetical protein
MRRGSRNAYPLSDLARWQWIRLAKEHFNHLQSFFNRGNHAIGYLRYRLC